MSTKGLLGWALALGIVGAAIGAWAKSTAGFSGSSISASETAGAIAGVKAALMPGIFAGVLILAGVALTIVAMVKRDA